MWHDLFSAFCFSKIFPQPLDCEFIQYNFVFLLRITWTEFLKNYFAIRLRRPCAHLPTQPPLPRLGGASFQCPARSLRYTLLYGTQCKARESFSQIFHSSLRLTQALITCISGVCFLSYSSCRDRYCYFPAISVTCPGCDGGLSPLSYLALPSDAGRTCVPVILVFLCFSASLQTFPYTVRKNSWHGVGE